MSAFKGDYLLLLPQEKEVCFKIKKAKKNADLNLDLSGLYLSENFVKKGWKMFLNKALSQVYILTGNATIRVFYLCGNVKIKTNKAEAGSVYVRIPYLCTSKNYLDEKPNIKVKARIKVIKTFLSQDETEEYILGKILFEKP